MPDAMRWKLSHNPKTSSADFLLPQPWQTIVWNPVSSALLTVLVTLAVGGAEVSVLQIAGVIGIYLIHNGIIEQFFIYPWIIGESLGLTTLETIIVVLLGGILAGIPGMIFALPAASVIKYLVPQIYRCWR